MKYSKEQAARVLVNATGNIVERDFWEALRDGELPTYFCGHFARFRLYSDDIPDHQLVAAWHPDYPTMKCRGLVILGIAGFLRRCVEYEIITEHEVVDTIKQFSMRQWNATRGSKGEFWTTQEEINLINTVLDQVIASLETTYGIHVDWEKARQQLDKERKISRKQGGV